MCGIVYSKSLVGKPVNKTIKKRYIAQRSRGSDGFGFYTPETNRLTHNAKEGRIMSLLRRNKKATEILFHHRYPTSTENVRNACHPFSTKDYFKHNYIVVHNGVIWNKDELRATHEQRGIDYVSEQEDGRFNDSEALAYDIAMYLEGKVDKLTAEGTMAIIAIQRDNKGRAKALYFGRNSGNPLMMKHTDKTFTLSSEGEGTLIDPDTMYKFDYKTQAISRSACVFPSWTKRSYYGDYEGYGYGHNWSPRDQDYEDYNHHFGISPTAETTRSYFSGEELKEQNSIAGERMRIMNQADYKKADAIDIGEYELGVMRSRRDILDAKVKIENITDDEMEEHYEIDDKMYYLNLAVVKLRKEVSGQNQMGFLYSPDHGTYPRSRLDTGESIDPETGYAYYPLAS